MSRPFGNKNKSIANPQGLKKAVGQAMESMIGVPTGIEADLPLSPAERVALLLSRIEQLKQDNRPNCYSQSFEKFLFECCVTKDEAAGGIVRPLPQDPYIFELIDAYMRHPLILVEKSRRVRVSWITCAFDVWLLAGGQDPRWVDPRSGRQILMGTGENRQIILASRKLEDLQGSQWFLQNRIKFIVDQLFRNDIREKWPSFPDWEWAAGEGRTSNGGYINAIASGPDQARGPGATLVHAEEIAFWPNAQPTIEGMLPVLLGGGHLIAITTANCNSYAHRIVKDEFGGKSVY